MSLDGAGAILGDAGVSLFVAGAICSDIAASLFVAGAIFGECWVDSQSAKCHDFPLKKRLQSGTSNLGEGAAGAGWPVHSRIIVNDASFIFWNVIFRSWQAQYLVTLD